MGGAGILFVAMFSLIFLGVPVAFSIAASSSIFLLITQMKPLMLVPQRMLTGLDSFPYLAIPLFVLVGNLMETGGISRRMVRWARSLVGSQPGGLGTVAVLACAVCSTDWFRAGDGCGHRLDHDPIHGGKRL